MKKRMSFSLATNRTIDYLKQMTWGNYDVVLNSYAKTISIIFNKNEMEVRDILKQKMKNINE